jgi:hypothetical protein
MEENHSEGKNTQWVVMPVKEEEEDLADILVGVIFFSCSQYDHHNHYIHLSKPWPLYFSRKSPLYALERSIGGTHTPSTIVVKENVSDL